MAEPEFTWIIHPETQNKAWVPVSSLGHHYQAGWAPLDETPEPGQKPPPEPVRAKKAAKGDDDTKEGE